MQALVNLVGDNLPAIAFCSVARWWFWCRVNGRTGKIIRCLPGAKYC